MAPTPRICSIEFTVTFESPYWKGFEFRAQREAIPMTATELAAWLGVSRMTIWRWEAGRTPIPAEIARAVSDAATEPSVREIAATDGAWGDMEVTA
jgi:predicted transcriptional regulator